jgi:hypothetical protein
LITFSATEAKSGSLRDTIRPALSVKGSCIRPTAPLAHRPPREER